MFSEGEESFFCASFKKKKKKSMPNVSVGGLGREDLAYFNKRMQTMYVYVSQINTSKEKKMWVTCHR